VRPDLDHWLERPVVCVAHRREAEVEPAVLWAAARAVRMSETRRLGRLVRWRIPGLPAGIAYDELFRSPPFTMLYEDESALLAGIVGRIWTLRRDYPTLDEPEDFRRWSTRGTVRVLFANWVEPAGAGVSALVSETRVGAGDRLAKLGLAAVRPLIVASHQLIGIEGLERAVSSTRGEAAPGRRRGRR
jgi:hypothetical protein